jgi:hypothetical protein
METCVAEHKMFETFAFGKLTLCNRLVVNPITPCRADAASVPRAIQIALGLVESRCCIGSNHCHFADRQTAYVNVRFGAGYSGSRMSLEGLQKSVASRCFEGRWWGLRAQTHSRGVVVGRAVAQWIPPCRCVQPGHPRGGPENANHAARLVLRDPLTNNSRR